REGPRSSLALFMDYALLCVGLSLTVGVVDEERDIGTGTAAKFSQPQALGHSSRLIATLVIKPTQRVHLMTVTAEPVHKMEVTSGGERTENQDQIRDTCHMFIPPINSAS
ncbi:hypothetical protein M9458_043020, partial [Cirrhinus mrigala]